MATSRREFLKILGIGATTAVAAQLVNSSLAFGDGKKKEEKKCDLPAGQTLVPATDPVAKALGYKADIKDIDYAKYPQRKDPKNKNQFCDNCSLYAAVDGCFGKCQMIASGLVAAKGWCGSYSKKA